MTGQPQHLQALQLANRARFERAELRAWVKEPAETVESRERLAAILDGPLPDCLRTLMLEDFMRWGWKLIPARRRAVCRLAGCSDTRTLGQLTDRQRDVIARALRLSTFDLEQARDLQEFEAIHGRAA